MRRQCSPNHAEPGAAGHGVPASIWCARPKSIVVHVTRGLSRDLCAPLRCGRRMSDSEPRIPAADAVPVQREATLGFRVARLTIGPLYRLLFRLQVFGREHIPRDRPYVLVCNHLNWLDPFTLLLAFPSEPRLHFLA